MNLNKLLEEYQKVSENLVNSFKNCDLMIIVKDGKTKVIENGKEIHHLRRIYFTAAADEIPTIEIEKNILKEETWE